MSHFSKIARQMPNIINRNYDNAIVSKVIAYNLMVMLNIKTGNRPREIMKIVVC